MRPSLPGASAKNRRWAPGEETRAAGGCTHREDVRHGVAEERRPRGLAHRLGRVHRAREATLPGRECAPRGRVTKRQATSASNGSTTPGKIARVVPFWHHLVGRFRGVPPPGVGPRDSRAGHRTARRGSVSEARVCEARGAPCRSSSGVGFARTSGSTTGWSRSRRCAFHHPLPAFPSRGFIARGVRADRGPARRGGARDDPPCILSRRIATIARPRRLFERRDASAHPSSPSVSSPPPTLQAFASGFLFGELLARCNLQPDFAKFINKNTPDARINNFTRLQVRDAPTPTFGRVPQPRLCHDRTLSSPAPPRPRATRLSRSTPRPIVAVAAVARRDHPHRRAPPFPCSPPAPAHAE